LVFQKEIEPPDTTQTFCFSFVVNEFWKGQTMKNAETLRALLAGGAIAALGATAAQADTASYEILSISPDPIVVLSNGQSYTQLQGNAPVIVETRVFLDVDVSGSIVSWWVQPAFQTGVGIATEVGGMWFSRHSESYPFGSRPNKVDKIVDLSVAASTLEDEAVSMCDTMVVSEELCLRQGRGAD
jgi:hypothetical protein